MIRCTRAAMWCRAIAQALWMCVGLLGLAWAQTQPLPRVDPRFLALKVYEVPPVVGQELTRAQTALADAGFTLRAVAVDRSRTDPARGQRRIVTRTDPVAGSRFTAQARPVVIVYHRADSPPDEAQPPRMPDLSGATCADARSRLAALGRRLNSCETGGPTGRFGPGQVNRQEPPAGALLGADVSARAWTEPDTTVVPPVTDLDVESAVARIEQARLRAVFDRRLFDAWHRVQSQAPPAGRRVAAQSAVELDLVGRYVVPDLTGRSCSQARALVQDAGLAALECEVEPGPGNPPGGRIHRQQPPSATVLTQSQPVQAWEQPIAVRVPDVVDRPEAEAVELLAQRRLHAVLQGPAASTGRRVATQSPPARTSVLPGSDVTLSLDLTVPRLNGMDCDAAGEQARRHGFDDLVCELRLAAPGQRLRHVFDQRPPAGSRLAEPQRLIALMARPVIVPDVEGRALPAALAALEAAQLKSRVDARDGDREVRSQRPPAGTEVAPGSEVGLFTQRFEPVPDVIGLSLADAQSRIADAGLVALPDQRDRESSRRVDRQAPGPGERVPVGGAVQLFTRVDVEVPDVVRQRLPDAAELLARSGLSARPDRSDHGDEREVRDQRPAAGELVPEHSEVTLGTVRPVRVPSLAGVSCADADARAREAGVALAECRVQRLLGLVLGEPVVFEQLPPADTSVDEGTSITALARGPVWPVPGLLTAMLSAGGGVWWWLRRRRGHRVPTSQVAPHVLHWRVAPDTAPVIGLRLADDEDRGTSGRAPQLRWRVVSDEPRLCLRGSGHWAGEPDEDRRAET